MWFGHKFVIYFYNIVGKTYWVSFQFSVVGMAQPSRSLLPNFVHQRTHTWYILYSKKMIISVMIYLEYVVSSYTHVFNRAPGIDLYYQISYSAIALLPMLYNFQSKGGGVYRFHCLYCMISWLVRLYYWHCGWYWSICLQTLYLITCHQYGYNCDQLFSWRYTSL